METRLVMLAAAELPGVAVSDLCRELGISRQTFYRLRRRVDAEGPAGLEPRSRRPRRSPGLIAPEVEDEIVRLRKTRPVDNGAQSIAYELARGGGPVLAASTVHRALRRRGLVVDTPAKRPKSSWRRFEFGAPNACWQIDATPWTLRRGRVAYVMDAIDDHSRTSVAAQAGIAPTGALAWATILAATAEWGPPARVLSDNGSCFTRRTITGAGPTDFERNLAPSASPPSTPAPRTRRPAARSNAGTRPSNGGSPPSPSPAASPSCKNSSTRSATTTTTARTAPCTARHPSNGGPRHHPRHPRADHCPPPARPP
jgi:transposase-like protein